LLRLIGTLLPVLTRRSSLMRAHLTYRMLVGLAAIERSETRR
jgi:hypothetical protein